jgi:hypothetical protein
MAAECRKPAIQTSTDAQGATEWSSTDSRWDWRASFGLSLFALTRRLRSGRILTGSVLHFRLAGAACANSLRTHPHFLCRTLMPQRWA